MPVTTIYRKRYDTAAVLRAQCLDGEDLASAVAVDLTGATSATLLIRKPNGTTLTGTCTIENQTTAKGWVNYSFGPTDLSVVGEHWIEIEVLWLNGTKQTFPAFRFAKLVVSGDVNNA